MKTLTSTYSKNGKLNSASDKILSSSNLPSDQITDTNLIENSMKGNQNQLKSQYDSNTTPLRLREELSINILHNALSTSMCGFGIKNSKFIKDTYRYFAEKCDYKAPNHFYSIFSRRPGYDLKVKDLKVIISETKDPNILEALIAYIKEGID